MTASLPETDQVILELWRDVSVGWGFASPKIADAFKRHALSEEQKKEIVETLHAMIAQYRRLDFALEIAGVASEARDDELALLCALRRLSGTMNSSAAGRFISGVDWDAVARVDEHIDKIDDPVLRFAAKYSLPDALAARFVADYPQDAALLLTALNARAPFTLRANTLKTTREELIAALDAEGLHARALKLSRFAVELENPARAFTSAAFRGGLFEAQDEGSQLVAELVQPSRGSRVLDACAGSGGKTLALSALMENTGTLFAVDVSEFKLEELRRRARRAGAHNIRALGAKPDAWPAEVAALSGKFKRVLADVPCSGSGAWRRNPESRWRGDASTLDQFPPLQDTLARRALEACAPGGRMIYSTCSVFRAENENVVEKLLAEGRCDCVPIKEILSKARAAEIATPCGRFLKLLPHIHGTDGFFAAVLRKRENH